MNESERQNRDGEENVPWGGNFLWPHGALKEYLRRLGTGEALESVRADFVKAVQR